MKYDSVVLATHVWADGASQAYKKYLLKKDNLTLFWIEHPLFYDKRLNGSGYELYNSGKLIKKNNTPWTKRLFYINYIIPIILNVYFVLKQNKRYQLYIGFNNLNAFAGLLLRKMGVVEKCIYHVTDFVPKRFNNKLLNWIYHNIERLLMDVVLRDLKEFHLRVGIPTTY